MVSVSPYDAKTPVIESLRTLELGSSSSVKIPTPWENTLYLVSHASFDGLVCLYEAHKPGFVVNPTTRWYRPLPLCQLQQLIISLGNSYYKLNHSHFKFGFGKDKFTGTYKPVWLYNSSEISLENATTCEVFYFITNAWRYVTPAAPYRVVGCPDPVYIDGSLHWFTECEETKILSFDLHTEAFQVISKAPFANVHAFMIAMCNLDNRLCVSEMKWPNQLIWSFNSANKTWDKMFSIDLEVTSWLDMTCALAPLTLFHGKNKEKKKLLFYSRVLGQALVVHDPETKSYDVAFQADAIGLVTPDPFFSSTDWDPVVNGGGFSSSHYPSMVMDNPGMGCFPHYQPGSGSGYAANMSASLLPFGDCGGGQIGRFLGSDKKGESVGRLIRAGESHEDHHHVSDDGVLGASPTGKRRQPEAESKWNKKAVEEYQEDPQRGSDESQKKHKTDQSRETMNKESSQSEEAPKENYIHMREGKKRSSH